MKSYFNNPEYAGQIKRLDSVRIGESKLENLRNDVNYLITLQSQKTEFTIFPKINKRQLYDELFRACIDWNFRPEELNLAKFRFTEVA